MVPTKNRKKSEVGDEFQTPKWVWEPWHRVLNFVLDAAASNCGINKLPPCKAYYDKHDNALEQDWAGDLKKAGLVGAAWCNPPYSRAAGPLQKWVRKGINEASKGLVVCMLLPADTSTDWFSLLWDRFRGTWQPGVQGYFTDVRVRFIDPRTGTRTKGTPNFGSLIVVLDSLVSLIPVDLPPTKEGITPSRAAAGAGPGGPEGLEPEPEPLVDSAGQLV